MNKMAEVATASARRKNPSSLSVRGAHSLPEIFFSTKDVTTVRNQTRTKTDLRLQSSEKIVI